MTRARACDVELTHAIEKDRRNDREEEARFE